MEGSQPSFNQLSDEAVIYLFSEQLPDLLEKRPDLEPRIYHAFLKTFVRKEEIVAVLQELGEFRAETRANFERVDQRFEAFQAETRANFEQVDQRFEQVDQRIDSLEARMEAGFRELHQAIDRLGSRWGIRNESIFRQTIASLLEQSFGVKVQEQHIEGEQFDCIIFDGQHILVEIAAHAKRDMQQRLERKRDLYIKATGVTPARVILAVGAIHHRQVEALHQAGFEVIQPED